MKLVIVKTRLQDFHLYLIQNGDYKETLKYFLNNRKWTNVAEFSPTLVKFFKEVISKYMHVFFSDICN